MTVVLIVACREEPGAESDADQQTSGANYQFFTGTYTDGESRGIYRYQIDSLGRLSSLGLRAETPNPSYLARFGDSLLLSVNELGATDTLSEGPKAAVSVYRRQGDSLLLLNTQPTFGAYPCHISVHPDGWVVSANYGGGSLSLFRLNEEGLLSPILDTLFFAGSGPHPRQEAPHAHSSYFLDSPSELLALDLGSDRIWNTGVNESDSTFANPFGYTLRQGSGPRHAVFHPNGRWIYVLQELANEVSKLELRNLRDTIRSIAPTYHKAVPNDFRGDNTGAELKISSDGKYLYASNRGHNSIAAFRISRTRGTLEPLFWQATAGERPRNFALTPDERYLIVANQDSQTLVSFHRDAEFGTLEPVDTLQAPTPVFLLFDD